MAESRPATTTPNDVPTPLLKRAVGAPAIGNAVEWFDYGVYGYGATAIAAALFPQGDSALFFTLVGFAISFLVRPLGGFFWGPLGDKLGRKRVLALTIIIMAAATFCVGLIPSYETIGIAAPVILYLLRMVQGFSTGGEYAGAATFMSEYAPDKRRGFWGSFLEVGTLAGFSLGALLMLGLIETLSAAQMESWGWRIPFLIAGPLGVIGFYLRSKMEDTPIFNEIAEKQEAEEQATGVFKDLFANYLPPLLKLSGLVIALNVVNYTLLAYMPSYLEATINLSSSQSLIVPIVGQLAMMLVLPFVGALSDRTGRKPMWMVSLVGLAVLIIPLYHLMAQGYVQAMIAFAILGLLYTPQLATISATFPAMFPTHVRYAGLAIGYNVATALFGGTAPSVNQGLIDATGDSLFPAYYMVAACLVGIVALLTMVETKGCSLRGTEIPGTEEALVEQRA
ncbi:MFS transporter [Nocardioides rotundus]|uniref:MFS transporter n=1 Tax=Nocardioides rotundus TaxID=1774216 RepID=UPI001CBAA00B|nr:MFS transporter [Nocardioides rotundus]UAL30845.1 MFS transporter [Nocardioides rotundus]